MILETRVPNRVTDESPDAIAQANPRPLNRVSGTGINADGTKGECLTLDAVIGVGVGAASLTCDGTTVYEQGICDAAALLTVADAERLAMEAPEREWCIHLVGLLDYRHFCRTGPGAWRLYRRGYGLS